MADRSLQDVRLVFALVLTPFVSALLMWACFPIAEHLVSTTRGSHYFDYADAAMSLAAGVFVLAAGVTVVGVLPVLLWLRKTGNLSLRRFVGLGVVLGNAPFATIVIAVCVNALLAGTLSTETARQWYGLHGAVHDVVLGTIIGVGSAVVFWIVAVAGLDRVGK